MKPLVSAVIPTYNYAHFVPDAVESVMAQTYEPIEVIVVDDGSTDDTREKLERFGDRIRVIHQENRGLPAARNTGIRAATGEFLAFLDSDDLWAPTKIEKQMRLIESSPEVGVVFCGVSRYDMKAGESVCFYPRPEVRGQIERTLLRGNCVVGSASAVLVRRACFDAVGLFEETLRSAEDWDMWIRISRRFQFEHVAELLVTLRYHGTNMGHKVATMHQYQLQVMRRALGSDRPGWGYGLDRRRGLAYIHADAGIGLYGIGEYQSALAYLLRSVALWPFHRERLVYLVRSLAGSLQVAADPGVRVRTPPGGKEGSGPA